MNNLENLYRQVIMDHYKSPRNKGLKGYPKVRYRNPSCGDDITIEAKIESGVIKEVRHEGVGCSICCASASILSTLMQDKNKVDAEALMHKYYDMLQDKEVQDIDELEEAVAFKGVSKFPNRIKCATIAWKALEELVRKDKDE